MDKGRSVRRGKKNGCNFGDDSFKCVFVNENLCVLLGISLEFVPVVSIDNKPALVLVMAWCHISNKALSETMMSTDIILNAPASLY